MSKSTNYPVMPSEILFGLHTYHAEKSIFLHRSFPVANTQTWEPCSQPDSVCTDSNQNEEAQASSTVWLSNKPT